MRRRGFTLLEMMVVVAIVGVMAGLSGYGLSQAVRVGRANAAADLLASVIRETRVRAVSEQCTQFIQINGLTYTVTPGGPFQAGTAYIVRKGTCDSTTMTFEQPDPQGYNDVVLDTTHFSDQLVDVAVTTSIVPGDDLNTTSSLIIGYNKLGQRFAAGGTGGTFVDSNTDGGTTSIDLTITPHDPTIQRVVQIPYANGPTLN